jgi:hypothetical protein
VIVSSNGFLDRIRKNTREMQNFKKYIIIERYYLQYLGYDSGASK